MRAMLYTCLMGLLLATQAPAQTWQQAVPLGVTVTGSATDFGGNVYLTGSFKGQVTIGGTTLYSTATTDADVFVAKWSPATTGFVWAVKAGGPGDDAGAVLATSGSIATSSYSIYLTGNFNGATATLGSTTLTNAGAAGTNDVFVAKLTDAGTWQWAARGGSPGDDYAGAVAVSNGNIYMAGQFRGATATFGSATLTNPVAGTNGAYLYLAKLTDAGSSGSFGWAQAGGGSSFSEFNGVVASGTSVYLAGNYSGQSANFGGLSVNNYDATGNTFDIVVAKYTDNGATASATWVKRAGGTGYDFANGLAVNGSAVYLCGGVLQGATAVFDGLSLNGAASPAYLARLTDVGSSASFTWLQPVSGAGAFSSGGYHVAVQGTGVYLTSAFTGASISLGGTTVANSSPTGSDLCVAKFTDSGASSSLSWATTAGGPDSEGVTGLAVSLSGAVYVAGIMGTSATFGSQTITNTNPTKSYFATIPGPGPVLSLVAPSSGPVGSTIALYGRNLTGTTSITFTGGSFVSSGFTVSPDGTQISGIVVPAGALSGPVLTGNASGNSNAVTFTIAPLNPGPAWQSVAAATSSSSISYATPDAGGNILVAGYFSGSLTLGSTTLTSFGGTDVFVAKWSPATGSYVWAQRAGGAGNESVQGLAQSAGSIYIGGIFDGGTAAFGTSTITSSGTANLSGFVAKLTDGGSSASFSWALPVAGTDDAYVEALAVSGTSVYIGGEYDGANLTIGTATSANNGSSGGYVAKLVDNGSSASFGWVQRSLTGANGYIFFNGLAVQGTTIYASAFVLGTVGFGSTSINSAGSSDVVLARLVDAGTSGSFTTALRAGGVGYDYAQGIACRGAAVYLSGITARGTSTWGGITLTPNGESDGFVAKVTDTGGSLAFTWVQLLGGPGYDYATRLALNGTGVYVVGVLGTTATLGGAPLTSAGGADGFVARLADAGSSASVTWAQSAGGPADDYFSTIALSAGRAYIGGYVTPGASFGSLAIASPVGAAVATLSTIADAAILAAAAPVAAAGGSHTLYPNPSHGTTTVQLAAGTRTVQVVDALGREVRCQAVPAGATEAVLSVAGLPAGLYVVRATGGTGAAATRRLQLE